jgi:hypothetical protein
MSTTTANYGYTKADPLEQYSVAVVNANLDAIDASIKTRETEIDALEADSGTVVCTMTNAAVWDHVAGHSLRYRKIGKLVTITGLVQWKSGVHAASVVCNIPVGFRPPFGEWFSSKAALTGGNDTVADFLLDATTGNISIPTTAYVQGSPVVNIIHPLKFAYFI